MRTVVGLVLVIAISVANGSALDMWPAAFPEAVDSQRATVVLPISRVTTPDADEQIAEPGTVEESDGDSVHAAAAQPSLQNRLEGWPQGIVRGDSGELVAVFGFVPQVARDVLRPVTRERELPSEY